MNKSNPNVSSANRNYVRTIRNCTALVELFRKPIRVAIVNRYFESIVWCKAREIRRAFDVYVITEDYIVHHLSNDARVVTAPKILARLEEIDAELSSAKAVIERQRRRLNHIFNRDSRKIG